MHILHILTSSLQYLHVISIQVVCLLTLYIICLIFACTVPTSPPRTVLAFALCSTEIQVIWTQVPEMERNGIITQYEVLYEPLVLSDCLTTLTVNTTDLTITLTGLKEYVVYSISVRAYNSDGTWTIQ